jgi:HD-like signal output (HDOD) protein
MSNELSFRILEDIARDLSGDSVSFPTFLDITFRVRTALKSPTLSIEQLAALVSAEPLMSTKIIRLANSVALNRTGRKIVDVNSAISLVGMEAVRSVSFAVAMEQLLGSKRMAPFEALSRRLWEHSIHVAALCRVLARRLTRTNPDEAMFTGLIHDIGVFYLLYRTASFPEMVADPASLHELLVRWHAEIGHALLAAMGMPDDLLTLVQEHELERSVTTVSSLADILFVANRLAGLEQSWREPLLSPPDDGAATRRLLDADTLRTLRQESRADVASLKSALGT